MIKIRKKFDALQEISEINPLNAEYENFVTTYIETEAKCILSKLWVKYRVAWVSIVVREKWDNKKRVSLLNKRNPSPEA